MASVSLSDADKLGVFCGEMGIGMASLHYCEHDVFSEGCEDHCFYKRSLIRCQITLATDDDEKDFIWIHNYHLLLVPSFIRKKLSRARIGMTRNLQLFAISKNCRSLSAYPFSNVGYFQNASGEDKYPSWHSLL